MASAPFKTLSKRLLEIDEILDARDAVCPPGAGRPAKRKGAAVLAGGTVLLSALFEGYIEDLYDLSVDTLYSGHPAADRNKLKEFTSEKNNNANVHQVNTLFFYLGVPWAMNHTKIHWQKFSNASVRKRLGELSQARNKIAHGASHTVRKYRLKSWREFILKLAEKLDEIAADRIQEVNGTRPW